MAISTACAAIATPLSLKAIAPAGASTSEPCSVRVFAAAGLKPAAAGGFGAKAPEWRSKTISNGSRVNCMQVLDPYSNLKYETLSYLPDLSDDAIAKQVDYLLRKGWIPCLEFDKNGSVYRQHLTATSGYYDGRYWTMWKLPMFGCNDSAQVLREIVECKKAYPNAYIRILGFDNKRQVQCCGFLVQKPE